MKSQSSLDLFCLRLGLPIEAANSLWLAGPIPFRSLQLSDSLPLPRCSRLLDLERDIDEPWKQSKPDKEMFNKVGFPGWEEKRIHIRPLIIYFDCWPMQLPTNADSQEEAMGPVYSLCLPATKDTWKYTQLSVFPSLWESWWWGRPEEFWEPPV